MNSAWNGVSTLKVIAEALAIPVDDDCVSNCKFCGSSRKDPSYHKLYRPKFCICLCHKPFSSKIV